MLHFIHELKEIVIPESIKKIGNYVFYNCSNLAKIDFNASNCADMGAIRNYTFEGISNNCVVTFSDSVNVIPAYLFYNSNIKEVTLGQYIESSNTYSFYGCSNLNRVNISDIYKYATINHGDSSNPLQYAGSLYLNGSLVEHLIINFPDLHKNAFIGAKCLKSVTFGVGSYYFSVPENAFSGCINLESVIFNNSDAKQYAEFGTHAFYNCTSLKTVSTNYINFFAYSSYSVGYSNPASVAGSIFVKGEIAENIVITCEDDEYLEFNHINRFSFSNVKTIKSLTIGDGIEFVDESAFSGCTNLTSVSLPSSLTAIKEKSFMNCSNLNSVTIPENVVEFGSWAFMNCSSLRNININATNLHDSNSIGGEMFVNISSDSSVTFGPNVTTIGTFMQKSNVKEINIPENIISFKTGAFLFCDNLQIINYGASSTENEGTSVFRDIPSNAVLNLKSTVSSFNANLFNGTNLYAINLEGNGDINISCNFNSSNFPKLSKFNVSSLDALYHCSFDTYYHATPLYYLGELYVNNELLENLVIDGWGIISKDAFAGLKCLKSITLRNNMEINEYAFAYCSNVESIIIDGLVDIGSNVFLDCSSATSVSINNVQNIGSNAFLNCTNLNRVNVENLSSFMSLNFENIQANPLYFAGNLYVNDELLEGVEISSETILKQYSFAGAYCLKNVTIYSPIEICESAFSNCVNLSSVVLPETEQVKIKGYAFNNCNSLETITIPKNTTSLNRYAFNNCTNLKEIYYNAENCSASYLFASVSPSCNLVIGDNVKSLPENFARTGNFKSVYIPVNMTSIGNNAFYYCSNLKTIDYSARNCLSTSSSFKSINNAAVLNLKATVVTLGTLFQSSNIKEVNIESSSKIYFNTDAFNNCANLSKLSVLDISTLYDSTFYNQYSNPLGYHGGDIYVDGKLLKSIHIYDEKVKNYTFVNLSSLNTIIVEESSYDSLTIENSAFYNCNNVIKLDLRLQNLNDEYIKYIINLLANDYELIIGDNISTIPEQFIFTDRKINKLTIGAGVVNIGAWAFGCPNLSEINYNAVNCNMFTRPHHTFDYLPDDCVVVFGNIETIPANLFMTTNINTVYIPSSVKTIGNYAFESCANLELVYIDTASNLDSIGNSSFINCTSLTNINLGNATMLKTLSESAFKNCSALKEINLPDSIEIMALGSFRDCVSLEHISLPASLTTDGGFLFSGCTSLSSIDLLKATQLEVLYNNTFAGTNILSIIIPSNIKEICWQLFYDCKTLENVFFLGDSSLESIQGQCFMNCSRLENIVIPEGVKKIYTNAFKNTGITSITLPSTIQRVGRNCFDTCTSVEFTGESLNHVWQIQDNNDNVIEHNVDITNATENATKMKTEWIDEEGNQQGYYYIRDDYEVYIQPTV